MTEQSESFGEKPVRIKRGRFDSLALYEITEHELSVLEEGSPTGLLLNFGIFCNSIGGSFLIALLTSPPTSDRTYIIFTVITCVSILAGFILFVLWLRYRTSVRAVVQRIKSRMPSEADVTTTTHSKSLSE